MLGLGGLSSYITPPGPPPPPVQNNEVSDRFEVNFNTEDALNEIDFKSTKSNGYAFQIEMTVLSLIANLKIVEIPITFNERREGSSKMSLGIVIEAFPKVILLCIKRIVSFLTTT